MCYTNGTGMIVNVHEIPYFGNILNCLCHARLWMEKTDFLSGDDNTPSKWELGINRETITARVVRSSSCTVRVRSWISKSNRVSLQMAMYPMLRVC